MSETEKKSHRQRLRERFASGEENSRSEEVLLELLLTYAIPQKDVQPIAQRLLAEFGCLSSLLETPIETLSKFDGIKENSAVLIKLVNWIRQRHNIKKPAREALRSAIQATLFKSISPEKTEQMAAVKDAPRREKVAPRRGTEMFGKAVLKETIEILPHLPLTSSMKEITKFLYQNLPFNSEQTRERRGRYIKFNMFVNGEVNLSLLKFARAFPASWELRDVCFYQFCHAQHLMVEVIEEVIMKRINIGSISRDMIDDYLKQKFPKSKAISDCVSAICEALLGAEIAYKKGKQILFSLRAIPEASFAFVLHSEFPEPGMYDIRKLEENRIIRAILWNPEFLLHALYELRNRGLISKISEIDNIRQFTTRYTLAGVVEQIVSGGKKA